MRQTLFNLLNHDCILVLKKTNVFNGYSVRKTLLEGTHKRGSRIVAFVRWSVNMASAGNQSIISKRPMMEWTLADEYYHFEGFS